MTWTRKWFWFIALLVLIYVVVGAAITAVAGGNELVGLIGGLVAVVVFLFLGPPLWRAHLQRQAQRRIDEMPIYPDDNDDA